MSKAHRGDAEAGLIGSFVGANSRSSFSFTLCEPTAAFEIPLSVFFLLFFNAINVFGLSFTNKARCVSDKSPLITPRGAALFIRKIGLCVTGPMNPTFLFPVSRAGNSQLGATIVDALDTLYIMGLHEEFKDGQEWIEQNLDFGVVCTVCLLQPAVL